ncbi:family 43 glycosylhydrolase [[Kitasatospora] papulosa]|uniref:family 43 glycosylhydrolase n=1 Tax=[Kitasatospora] papulosa TaxID=1464011 RepID=UPI0036BC973D
MRAYPSPTLAAHGRSPDTGNPLPLRVTALFAVLITLAAWATLFGSQPARAAASAAPSFTNPVNSSGPDPYMTYYQGYYYVMTTPWSGPLTMRKAPTIETLKQTAPVPVFDDFPSDRCCQVWAPEMHLLDGPNGKRWYIYYSAGTGDIESQRVHVLESAGTDPMGPYTYKGMAFGANDWWGIDGSVVTIDGKLYLTWSGVPTAKWADSDPHIYIAALANPWTVSGSARTVVSAPTLAWETQRTPMNEGPVALQHDGTTRIVYSASACQGPDYKLGMLTYTGGDVLSASSWTKSQEPVFQRSDANSVYGPGHNGFFTSPDGTENWIVYHANASASQGCGSSRTTRIQRFSWNADGTPDFGTPVDIGTQLVPPSGEASVTHQRITNRNSSKVVDVQMPNTRDLAVVGQYAPNDAAWQKWRFVGVGAGYFRIESLHSAKCLDVLDHSTADGAFLVQYNCHGRANQLFQWRATGDGYHQLVAQHSGKCLTVAGGSTADAARLEQRSCSTGAAFQWTRA